MKKILAIIALMSCGAASAYGVTFSFPTAAGTFVAGATTTPGGVLNIKPSANVAMGYDCATAVGVSYTIGSIHGQGSKVFGTSSVDTNIFYQDVAAPGVPTTAGAELTWPTGAAAFPGSAATTPATYFSTGWTASK